MHGGKGVVGELDNSMERRDGRVIGVMLRRP